MNYQEEVFRLSDRMRLISLDKSSICVQAKYGPSRVVKLPLSINEDISCLTALIIGDGHLLRSKFRTSIESSNKELLVSVSNIIKSSFHIKPLIKNVKKREGKKQTYHLTIYSKAVQELLSRIFSIPLGKKSHCVRVPIQILNSNKAIKSAFIIGLLAAEGSKKDKKRVRICSASKKLLLDSQDLLKKLEVNSSIESWINKKYKKEYYSLSFKRDHLDSLMRGCRSGQTGQILSIFRKVIGDHA